MCTGLLPALLLGLLQLVLLLLSLMDKIMRQDLLLLLLLLPLITDDASMHTGVGNALGDEG